MSCPISSSTLSVYISFSCPRDSTCTLREASSVCRSSTVSALAVRDAAFCSSSALVSNISSFCCFKSYHNVCTFQFNKCKSRYTVCTCKYTYMYMCVCLYDTCTCVSVCTIHVHVHAESECLWSRIHIHLMHSTMDCMHQLSSAKWDK